MVYNKTMRLKDLLKTSIFLTILIVALNYPAFSEEIYKWTDKQGKVHYSTKPVNKNAKIADLPEITRGEVKIPASLLDSCKNHGGIDCQSGADSDGSVKCSDGFTDSAQRYAFSCSTARLEVSSISEVNRGGGFTVNIRNSKSVAAENPKVVFKFEGNKDYELSGPLKIAPFEVGEFLFDPDTHLSEKDRIEVVKRIKPTQDKFELACSNCP